MVLGVSGEILVITAFNVLGSKTEVGRRAESPDVSMADQRKGSGSSDSSLKPLTVLYVLFPRNSKACSLYTLDYCRCTSVLE